MDRLLIFGSSEDFTELTKMADERGIYTVVVDGNHDGEAKKYAAKTYDVDISNVDGVNQIIQYEKIDRILTSFSDNLFEYMVRYSAENGLPCNCPVEKVEYLRDKFMMKKMLDELGIPNKKGQVIKPGHFRESDIILEYPFIAKPVDGWGSRGVHIVNNYRQLQEVAAECASFAKKDDSILLEELNIGHEMNIMSWVKDGTVTFLQFADREVYGGNEREIPHYNRIIHPSFYREKIIDRVREYLKKIADYIDLQEGPLSTQLFYNPETDEISIGEIVGRFFGFEKGFTDVINGVSINTLLLNMAFDSKANAVEIKNYECPTNHYSMVVYVKARKGIVRDLGNAKLFTSSENIHHASIYAYPGVDTAKIPALAAIYARFSSREEADTFTRNLYEDFYIPDLNGENLAVVNKLPVYI